MHKLVDRKEGVVSSKRNLLWVQQSEQEKLPYIKIKNFWKVKFQKNNFGQKTFGHIWGISDKKLLDKHDAKIQA